MEQLANSRSHRSLFDFPGIHDMFLSLGVMRNPKTLDLKQQSPEALASEESERRCQRQRHQASVHKLHSVGV